MEISVLRAFPGLFLLSLSVPSGGPNCVTTILIYAKETLGSVALGQAAAEGNLPSSVAEDIIISLQLEM